MSKNWHFVSQKKIPILNYILPPVTILLAQIFELLPGKIFSGMMPLLGVCVVFYWSLYRPQFIPLWQTFFLGLLADVFLSSVLGLHALIYMFARQIGKGQRRYLSMRNFKILWGTFSVMIAGIVLIESFYMTTTGYAHDPLILIKVAQTCFAFPLVYYFLARVHKFLIYEGWL